MEVSLVELGDSTLRHRGWDGEMSFIVRMINFVGEY